MQSLEQLPIPLLAWYREHARSLPWRSPPESGIRPQPYGVWISEIMLQQTRVAAVLGYYQRFMDALPTVADLAVVEEDVLMKLWQGLGYYNRARNLQKAANQIMTDWEGQFPSTYEGLLSLAGIGSYTAGAIGSISFDLPVPAVDGNVLRVVARITADEGDILKPDTKKRMESALTAILPVTAVRDFNQALMELGATVCLPNGAPLCQRCPAQDFCRGKLEGLTDRLPVKAPKKARKIEERQVLLLFRGNQVALRRRPAKGLLAKLWEYPNRLVEESEQWGFDLTQAQQVAVGKHMFTHIEWHMTAVALEVQDEQLPEGWVWASAENLAEQYAVPNAFQFVQEAVQQRIARNREE